MAKSKKIPNSIKELTALALQDRILTLKEREVIVKAALKKGMSKNHDTLDFPFLFPADP